MIWSSIFASLESRVKLLENLVSEHTKHLSATRNVQAICNTPSESVDSLADNNQQTVHSSSSPAPLRIVVNVPADQEQPLEDVTDGMAITLTDDQESIYFGKQAMSFHVSSYRSVYSTKKKIQNEH